MTANKSNQTILLLLFTFFLSQCNNEKKDHAENQAAPRMIKDFYSAYLDASCGEEINEKKIDSILSKYCTTVMLNDLKVKNEEADGDLLIDGQFCETEWLQNMTVAKDSSMADTYNIKFHYTDYFNKKQEKKVKLQLVRKGESFLIDKVLLTSKETSSDTNTTEAFESFATPLKELILPAKIEINYGDTTKMELTNSQMKIFAPSDCPSQTCRVFALDKIKKDDLTGILYLYKYPEDPTDYQALTYEIYLSLYDAKGKISDNLRLAVLDGSTGSTYMKSWNEIIYLVHAEMEFINLTKTVYSLVGNKFKKGLEESRSFNGDEKGNKKFQDYLQNIMK